MKGTEEFSARMAQIIDRILLAEKTRVFSYGDDLKLYSSEIHFLLFLDKGYTCNSTEMAKRLRITKGALSQTISRLEGKGVLTKTKDPYRKNEMTISFTPLGKKVLAGCKRFNLLLIGGLGKYFDSLPQGERRTIDQFTVFLLELLDGMEADLQRK
jgi:DNA-binding MarR family transcriptional regulator